MRITVTQDDIDRGVRLNADQCPVALAATRAFGCHMLLGYSGKLWPIYEDVPMPIECPPEVRAFAEAFDWGLPVEPFEFEVTQ